MAADMDDAYERFTALLTRHHSALLGFILSLRPNWTDAEDLLQQTSVVLWRKFSEFREGTNFAAWACQTARYLTLNHVRKVARDPHVFSEELLDVMSREAADDVERLQAQRAALSRCMEKLDAKGRKLLTACYEAGASVKEAADRIGATPNAVYKSLNRLREALLDCVRRNAAGEGA
jgi:RNA polymerase sigma-70 factor (ECF subfamily)